MKQGQSIIFVCAHGWAKSVVAAAHFNRIAAERGYGLLAVSRGTDPHAKRGRCRTEGRRPRGLRAVSGEIHPADAAGAAFVVTFCELPHSYATAAPVEQCDGLPPVSADYAKARDEIVVRIGSLIDGLGLGVAALDFVGYCAHRLLHMSWLGWRFHRVQHSEAGVDATTAFRQHRGETAWPILWQLAAVVVFGLPLWVVPST